MGNAEAVGEASDDSFEEDDDFENEIDGILKEVDQEETGRQTEMAFNTGGFVNPSYYDVEKAPKNPALDIRYFNDSEGKTFYMPFINGKPMKPMPNGAVQTSGPAPKTSTTGGGGGDAGGAAAGAGVAGVIADTRDLTSTTASTVKSGDTTTSSTATQQQQISDAKDAGASSGISGVYTGSNLADFGKNDMIYNPGGSGAAGELTIQDLHSGITTSDVKLATTIGSAIASAMGIPGIATLPARLAINKFGADKYNEWIGKLNQEITGKAGGLDTSTTEGRAGAASQIDQLTDKDSSKPAASAGAIGTGSIAAQASTDVSDALRGTGLSDDQIGTFAQRAADAIVSGIDMNTAVNNAKNAAVDALQATELGSYMSKEEIANTVFNRQPETQMTDTGFNMPYESPPTETTNVVPDDVDFWSWDTMDGSSTEEEETEDSRFFNSGPTSIVRNPFKKKETQRD
jgi:hypothetical protein